MSRLSELKRAGAEDFPGAPEWFVEQFLPFQNGFNEDVFNRVNGDIGVVNTNNTIKTVKLVHGVEKIVRNPLADKRIRPVGVKVLGTNGLPVVGNVQMRNVANGRIGLTAWFEGRHTEPLLIKSLASAFSINNNANVTVNTWNTDANAEVNRGGVISESAGTWRVSEAGLYACSFMGGYEAGTYDAVQLSINPSGAANWATYLNAPLGNGPYITINATMQLPANGTFILQAFQVNSVPTARTLLSGAGNTRAAVSRLYNSTVDDYEAAVKLYFVGG